jgi:DNA-binding HxlR family transcriptional regulator
VTSTTQSRDQDQRADAIACSIAGTLAIVGDRWSMLILREAFLRTRRFDEFQRRLGIARNILASRLQQLVAAGILERRQYQERPARYEYRLTQKGIDLWPSLVALMEWGDRYLADAGPPMQLRHTSGCGKLTTPRLTCSECGETLTARDVRPEPGPGAVDRAA